jgi:hypothetical protein
VDPDDHHLFVSLGCAAENLVIAATAAGMRAVPNFDAATDAVRVTLEPAPAFTSPQFKAIAERQCTRGEHDGKPVGAADLAVLERASTSDHLKVMLLTD